MYICVAYLVQAKIRADNSCSPSEHMLEDFSGLRTKEEYLETPHLLWESVYRFLNYINNFINNNIHCVALRNHVDAFRNL